MTPAEREARLRVTRRRRFPTEHLGRQKIWQAIRIARTFDRAQLEAITGCTYKSIELYIVLLAKAGYIEAIGTVHGKLRGRLKAFRLVRDTGPKPPAAVRRAPNTRSMYDHNEGRLYEFKT